MESTTTIIENYERSVEKFINVELYKIINISSFCKDKIYCNFKYPTSINIGSNLQLDFYTFSFFSIKFNNLNFVVTDSNVRFSQSQSEIDKLFLNFSYSEENSIHSEIFKSLGNCFKYYINNYIDFVETNISIIISDTLEMFLNDKENVTYFNKPKFQIKKIIKSATTFVYKRGEGYQQRERGTITYELIKNSELSQEQENSILILLEKKKENYYWSENGHSFIGNNTSFHSSSEVVDVSLTRFLLNYNGKKIYDNQLEKKLEKKFERVNKKHLYVLTFIFYCDLNEYLKNIKSKYLKDDFLLIKIYYYTLYSITEMLNSLGFENRDWICSQDFDTFVNYNIQNFEYITEKVNSIFSNNIDNYFDLFLINLVEPDIKIHVLCSSLDDFLKSQTK